jgi:hypothetical protein
VYDFEGVLSGLKIPRPKGCPGSTPGSGTTSKARTTRAFLLVGRLRGQERAAPEKGGKLAQNRLN